MLNVDCDMFANNPQVALHAMCLLLGFDDDVHSGFVQAPQKFYGALKDDPFGNQMQVLFEVMYTSLSLSLRDRNNVLSCIYRQLCRLCW
jgi:hypothetical protein